MTPPISVHELLELETGGSRLFSSAPFKLIPMLVGISQQSSIPFLDCAYRKYTPAGLGELLSITLHSPCSIDFSILSFAKQIAAGAPAK